MFFFNYRGEYGVPPYSRRDDLINMKKDQRETDHNRDLYTEYYKYFDDLFSKAGQQNGLEYIFTLLRVSGIEDGGWDPFIEAEDALNDFSKTLRRIKKGNEKSAFRYGLLIYCHAIEMSAPYQILFNLLQCIQKKHYIPFPFPGAPLGKKAKSKKGPFAFRPMSPVQKIELLREEAAKANQTMLIEKIESFFDDEIRNAFVHSDYTIVENELRICDGNIAHGISLETVSEKLSRCFAFYQAFFNIYKQIRRAFRKSKKIHRLSGFEVFETVTNKKEGLVGFKMHFSNGSHAFFERTKERVHGMNVMLQDNQINFMVGDLSKLQRKWLVNGKTFREKNTRYNPDCIWRPILFRGKSEEVIKETELESTDPDVQGCLFYIKCTGHESIEFVIKSDKEIFKGEKFTSNKIQLVVCGVGKKNYIYDGTYFVNSSNARLIKAGLNKIESFIQQHREKGLVISYQLKYLTKSSTKPIINPDGTFSVMFSMENPKNTLCASDFGIFPNKEWRIKEEWLD